MDEALALLRAEAHIHREPQIQAMNHKAANDMASALSLPFGLLP